MAPRKILLELRAVQKRGAGNLSPAALDQNQRFLRKAFCEEIRIRSWNLPAIASSGVAGAVNSGWQNETPSSENQDGVFHFLSSSIARLLFNPLNSSLRGTPKQSKIYNEIASSDYLLAMTQGRTMILLFHTHNNSLNGITTIPKNQFTQLKN